MPIYKTNAPKKDGKAQYRVMVSHIVNGERKQLSGRVYGSAEAKELEIALEQQFIDKALPNKMTMMQLYEDYMRSKINEVRRSSYEKSKSILKNHVLNTDIMKVRLEKLNVSMLQAWKNDLAQKDLMLTTKNNVIRELNIMLNYAVRMEYIPKNPMSKVGKFKDAYLESAQKELRYYTPEEFAKYITVAYQNRDNLIDYACYVFFCIAFFTGMRKGEIHALKWSDIEGNTIHVRRSLNQKTKGGYTEGPPKTKSSIRDLQMPLYLINVLNEYKSTLIKNYDWNENMRVVGGISPISDTNVENHNKQYAELSGLKHIRIHDFRHSHASVLCNANINIKEIARRLGHSKVETTWKTYAHLYPSTSELAVSALNNIESKIMLPNCCQ